MQSCPCLKCLEKCCWFILYMIATVVGNGTVFFAADIFDLSQQEKQRAQYQNPKAATLNSDTISFIIYMSKWEGRSVVLYL